MEKHKPHYDLEKIKLAFSDTDNLGQMTGSARDQARSLKLSDEDIAAVVRGLGIRDFYKSMTSLRDHMIWQDVYLPCYRGVKLYVKFTRCEEDDEYLLLSFKEKNSIGGLIL